MRFHVVAAALVVAAGVAHAGERDTPPVEGGRIAGEIAIGSFVGAGGAVAGALIAARLGSDSCSGNDDACQWTVILLGAMPGVTLGAATGAWIVSRGRGQTSSYIAGLGGAAVGALGAYGSWRLTADPVLRVATFIVAPAVGAAVGVTLSREYREVVIEPRVTASSDHALVGIGGRF